MHRVIDYTIIMSLRPILLILFYHSLAYVLKYFAFSGLLHLLCKTWCILDVGPRVHIRSLSCSHTPMPDTYQTSILPFHYRVILQYRSTSFYDFKVSLKLLHFLFKLFFIYMSFLSPFCLLNELGTSLCFSSYTGLCNVDFLLKCLGDHLGW